jgi:hypothetical protein
MKYLVFSNETSELIDVLDFSTARELETYLSKNPEFYAEESDELDEDFFLEEDDEYAGEFYEEPWD